MSKLGYHQREAIFHGRLWRELVDAGILESGMTHPTSVTCPHCRHLNYPEHLLADQAVTCAGENLAPGGKLISKGCGATFEVKASAPMHILRWCGMNDYPPHGDWAGVPGFWVECYWRKGVGPTHPARVKFLEIFGRYQEEVR